MLSSCGLCQSRTERINDRGILTETSAKPKPRTIVPTLGSHLVVSEWSSSPLSFLSSGHLDFVGRRRLWVWRFWGNRTLVQTCHPQHNQVLEFLLTTIREGLHRKSIQKTCVECFLGPESVGNVSATFVLLGKVVRHFDFEENWLIQNAAFKDHTLQVFVFDVR